MILCPPCLRRPYLDNIFTGVSPTTNKKVVAPGFDRREIEEVPRFLRDALRRARRPMLRLLRQIAVDVGLVDSARHGDDNDGGDGGVFLLEEGIERHTVAGVVNNSLSKNETC